MQVVWFNHYERNVLKYYGIKNSCHQRSQRDNSIDNVN
jgi:hypothetical protein